MSKQITDDEFDSILRERVRDAGSFILRIPGVYEILSEYYNNEVLEIWEAQQEVERDFSDSEEEDEDAN
jgi:hypothetical protein